MYGKVLGFQNGNVQIILSDGSMKVFRADDPSISHSPIHTPTPIPTINAKAGEVYAIGDKRYSLAPSGRWIEKINGSGKAILGDPPGWPNNYHKVDENFVRPKIHAPSPKHTPKVVTPHTPLPPTPTIPTPTIPTPPLIPLPTPRTIHTTHRELFENFSLKPSSPKINIPVLIPIIIIFAFLF